MSQDKLDSKMIDKSIEEREKMLEDSRKKADTILKNAEAERHRINELSNQSIQGIIGSEIRAVHDRIVGRAQLEGRKKVLEARMEAMSKVYDQALEEIKTIAAGKNKDHNYEEILTKMIIEADAGIADAEYIVQANKKDLDYLKANLASVSKAIGGKKLILNDTPVDIIGGLLIANTIGTKSMENTLDSRLEAAYQRLQSEIADKLGVI
ncbi:MAG: V-type ATP synthase subunit E [Candidatus Bathyarchaeota archaeon]|nr:V-type ATP synthase subunit E [Candidatus Bathyarchaeota archaeon]